jgi:signal transduction histidine kinase
MNTVISRSSRNRLLEIPVILAIVAVTVAGLIDLQDPSERVFAAILLAAFAIVLFSPFPRWRTKLLIHVRLAILSMLTAALMTTHPGWNFFPILFFLLAPMALIDLPVKTGLVWIGVFTLITAAAFYLVDGLVGLALLLPFASGYVFFGIFGWMMVESERNRVRSDQLLAELQAAHLQLQDYTARVEELTIAQERNRIAREMHDTLGHRLTIAAVQLEGAQRLIPSDPNRAAAILGTVREQVKEGLGELRRTVAMLRASVEEDLPLDKALVRLVDQVEQATALKIHLSLEDCPANLSQAQSLALYRAAQECLTNIQRHAKASEAWLQLTAAEGIIHLLISDNGVGFSPGEEPSGFGLAGLKERAALQGGEFHVDPRPGGGTQVSFSIPQVTASAPQPVDDESCGGARG